ncbi:MAG: hypothetical protein P4L51_20210 [Puia sp.]|nr:hypothetical protein [Puia sp.]
MNSLFSIPIVATAIAIVVSWALFAIFCSLVQESVAQIKAERGRFMKKYLLSQLQDLPNGVNWASLLYMHGTIDLLSRAPEKPTSDISPRLFAESLIEVVGNSDLVRMGMPAFLQTPPPGTPAFVQPALTKFYAATRILRSSDVVSFFTQAIDMAHARASLLPGGALNEPEVYKNLIDDIENWYTEFGQRMTLWYKKKVRQRLFLLGVLLALFVNVDSIQLFTFFNDHPEARTAIADFYKKNGEAYSNLANRLKDSSLAAALPATDSALVSDSAPVAGSLSKKPLTKAADYNKASDSLSKMAKSFYQSIDTLKKANNLPVGFDYSIVARWKTIHDKWNWNRKDFGKAFWKILGILISGFAASMGAPYWFDLLKKTYSTSS